MECNRKEEQKRQKTGEIIEELQKRCSPDQVSLVFACSYSTCTLLIKTYKSKEENKEEVGTLLIRHLSDGEIMDKD